MRCSARWTGGGWGGDVRRGGRSGARNPARLDPPKVGGSGFVGEDPRGHPRPLPPHFHPTGEAVEGSRGTLLFGMGDTLDVAKTQAMKVGAKGSVAANMHHFVIAKGLTVVIVTSMGPFAMTYVNQP